MLPFLNEKQRGVFAAAEARAYGRGGIKNCRWNLRHFPADHFEGLTDFESKIKDLSIRPPGGEEKGFQRLNLLS